MFTRQSRSFLPVKWQYLIALLLLTGPAAPIAFAQIDTEDRTFLTLGTAITTGSADPTGSGFLYWHRTKVPYENTNLGVIFAGPFLSADLIFPNLIGPSTSLGFSAGTLVYLASFTPEFVGGIPLRNEKLSGYSAWAGVWVNHEFGQFTEYKIPLNLKIGYESNLAWYQKGDDLRSDYRMPTDPWIHGLETKLQFGGYIPRIRKERAIDLHVRHILGHATNWEDFGPRGKYNASKNFQKLILSAGLAAPLINDQTFGLRLTAAQGWDLDRSTMYQLGGALLRGEESTRIVGYYTNEFMAEDYYLVNFSYEIPVTEWRELAVHGFTDHAQFRRTDDRAQGWRQATGVGVGVSFLGPWDSDVMVQYGYALNAVRPRPDGRNEIAIKIGKSF